MKTLRHLATLAGLLALALVLFGAPPALADTPGYDVNDCKTCHEAAFNQFKTTQHAAQGCNSCHGDVTEHVKGNLEKGEPGPIKKFGALKAAEIDATCLTCHDSGKHENWKGGVHERRGVSCTSCHSVHSFKSPKGQLKTVSETENCSSCHQNIRAKLMRTSHHPVREGKMACSSCHDPHDGATPKMIKGNWINESCLTCHTEKRGPFLWEHAPVRENCALCHDPHGSNHDKLLVAKQPFLCQRCHLNTRHPGTLYDRGNSFAGPTVSPGAGNPIFSSRAAEHACKNCHQNVHGGNGPSGPYLGR